MAMTLLLSPEDEQALTLVAEAEGVSKQEATVRAIREELTIDTRSPREVLWRGDTPP